MSNLKSKTLNILFWSVISAAFIGPGTVTTALSAGAGYQYSLLWALGFATFACIVLQEGAARITIGTGRSMGEVMASRSGKSATKWILALSVIFGCAAYQAGNMLGAISGLELILPGTRILGTTVLFITAFLVMWFGGGKQLMRFMGILVLLMGISFIIIVFGIDVNFSSLLKGLTVPRIPQGSALLTIGLIGTTIVPYNLFLGSGISKNQSLSEMRAGLIPAVLLGGVISVFILISGTIITDKFSFQLIYKVLQDEYGIVFSIVFAAGLFAAGFTSSLTSPVAAGITSETVIKSTRDINTKSKYYRITWIGVLLTGFLFGISGVKAIPIIIMAQAINGILLPTVVVFMILILNDKLIMNHGYKNTVVGNIMMLLTIAVSGFLGLYNIMKAIIATFSLDVEIETAIPYLGIAVAFLIFWILFRIRNSPNNITY